MECADGGLITVSAVIASWLTFKIRGNNIEKYVLRDVKISQFLLTCKQHDSQSADK